MIPTNENEINRNAGEILKYLESHPNAADSIHGIARWWLLKQRYSNSLRDTELALKQLEERKLVEKLSVVGGAVIYRALSKGKNNG